LAVVCVGLVNSVVEDDDEVTTEVASGMGLDLVVVIKDGGVSLTASSYEGGG